MSGIVGTSHSKSKIVKSGNYLGKTPDTVLAWCAINGTGTIAVRDSFNFGAVVDSGTGTYDFYFLSNLVANKYLALATVDANNKVGVNNKLANYVRLLARSEGDAYADVGYADVAVWTN